MNYTVFSRKVKYHIFSYHKTRTFYVIALFEVDERCRKIYKFVKTKRSLGNEIVTIK